MKQLLIISLALLTFSTSAQQLIKGSISDAEGTVPFVNVIIKHSTKGVLADENGNFSIEAKSTDTLQISSLGYATKEVSVGNQKQLQITLDEFEQLDEVVVVGYANYSKCITTCCCVTTICVLYKDELDEESNNKTENFEMSKLYPNPSKDGIFNLKIPNDVPEVDVIVADLTGRVILKTTRVKLNSNVVLDLSQQPTGIYIVNLNSHGKQITSKKALRL